MKYLKKFNESFVGQLWEAEDAREVINRYWNVVDEVSSRYSCDFLVEADDFLEKMSEHDGYIAGNYFSGVDHIRKDISELYTISPHVYIAPFWRTRTEEDIAGGDIYADTIFIPYMEGITGEDGKVINSVFSFLNPDELGVTKQYRMESKSGDAYIRIWWD